MTMTRARRVTALVVAGCLGAALPLAPARATAEPILLNQYIGADDPNRDPNWDWTQNVEYALYVTGLPEPVVVRLPYYEDEGHAGGDLDIGGTLDIFPEHGWVLVLRDFGSPTSSQPGLPRPTKLPRFILYNKYRGLLRLFYWSPLLGQTYSRGVAKLYFQQQTPEKTAALMTFSGPEVEYVNAYNPGKVQIAIGKIVPYEWAYVDFDVSGYDPGLADKVDVTFVIEIFGIVDSDIVLEGTIRTLEGGTTTVFQDIGTLLSAYEKPAKRYKQVVDAQTAFYAPGNPPGTPPGTPLPAGPVGDFLRDIQGMAPVKWLKSLAPAIGFVEAVLGLGSTGPLMINATVKLKGNLTTPTGAYTMHFRVPGSQHSNPANDAANNTLPLYDRPLGVFNLLSPPKLEAFPGYPSCYYSYDAEGNAYEFCEARSEQRLASLDYRVNPDSGLVVEALDLAYIPSQGGLPDFYVEGSSDGYRPFCELDTVRQVHDGEPDPSKVRIRNIGLRARLRAPAAPPDAEPLLIMRLYRPSVSWVEAPVQTPDTCPTTFVHSPFVYSSAEEQNLACWGISGHISSSCGTIADVNDRQLCYAMSSHVQAPCTQITDRSLQLACYGMSVAPNYPSNCRDIINPEMRDFCFSVSSWGRLAGCSGVTGAADRALCLGLTYRNPRYCEAITNTNDRSFCYGTSSHNTSSCRDPGYCDPVQRQACLDQGGSWDAFYCSCTLPPPPPPPPPDSCPPWGGTDC